MLNFLLNEKTVLFLLTNAIAEAGTLATNFKSNPTSEKAERLANLIDLIAILVITDTPDNEIELTQAANTLIIATTVIGAFLSSHYLSKSWLTFAGGTMSGVAAFVFLENNINRYYVAKQTVRNDTIKKLFHNNPTDFRAQDAQEFIAYLSDILLSGCNEHLKNSP